MTGEEGSRPAGDIDGAPETGMTTGAGRLPVDETIRVLANQRRRAILRHLLDRPDWTAHVEDLVDVVVASETASRVDRHRTRERVTISVRCVQLPYLAEAELVAYDADTQQVRYRGDARLEALLRCVDDHCPE